VVADATPGLVGFDPNPELLGSAPAKWKIEKKEGSKGNAQCDLHTDEEMQLRRRLQFARMETRLGFPPP
jgi:hypothetical protein